MKTLVVSGTKHFVRNSVHFWIGVERGPPRLSGCTILIREQVDQGVRISEILPDGLHAAR